MVETTVNAPVLLYDGVCGFCHGSVEELVQACQDFIARINRDPITLLDRLWPKFELNPEFEEKLRVSS